MSKCTQVCRLQQANYINLEMYGEDLIIFESADTTEFYCSKIMTKKVTLDQFRVNMNDMQERF